MQEGVGSLRDVAGGPVLHVGFVRMCEDDRGNLFRYVETCWLSLMCTKGGRTTLSARARQ